MWKWGFPLQGGGRGENEPRLLSWLVLVTHRLGLPLHGSPLWLLIPLHVALNLAGPHPSVEGRGTTGLELHGGERARWAARWMVVVLKGEMNQTSTIDAVDVRFKLRSHEESSCSILAHSHSIRKIKVA